MEPTRKVDYQILNAVDDSDLDLIDSAHETQTEALNLNPLRKGWSDYFHVEFVLNINY